MNNTSRNYQADLRPRGVDLDLTIGNVQRWRERSVRVWTSQRTAAWWQLRDRAAKEQGRRHNDWYAGEWIWRYLDRFIFWPAVVAGAICLTFVVANFLGTILSGRLTDILGGR